MIPQSAIIEWKNFVPWTTFEQVEQDLIISRAVVDIFNNEFLSRSLAFRGGTALHKLYILPQPRYSEDIDLVQIRPEPIKETVQQLQDALAYLGSSSVEQKKGNTTLKFRFESEIAPVQPLRLKIETNCREHFTILGWEKKEFSVDSQWFSGTSQLTTYKIEELLGTKLRALYQRRKGRDLYDIHKALISLPLDITQILKCYNEYMAFSVDKPPTQKQFLLNLAEKMKDTDFLGDTVAILRPTEKYDPIEAYESVISNIISKI